MSKITESRLAGLVLLLTGGFLMSYVAELTLLSAVAVILIAMGGAFFGVAAAFSTVLDLIDEEDPRRPRG